MESLCGCKIPDGHPLFVLYKENDAISKKLAALRDKLLFDEPVGFDEAMDDVLLIRSHYEKKPVLYAMTEDMFVLPCGTIFLTDRNLQEE